MDKTSSKSFFLPYFFTGVIKSKFQQFGNLPLETISLKSKDEGSEWLLVKALISTIGMSNRQVVHFLVFLIFFSTSEGKITVKLGEHKS